MSLSRLSVTILLLFSQACLAQDNHVLRLVTFRGEVTLDDASVKPGHLIYPPSKILQIKKGGYAYVLTPAGHSYKLESGKYDVPEVENTILLKKENSRKRSSLYNL